MFDIYDLFDEFDADSICVSDFGILFRGARVDNIVRTNDGEIKIYGGDPTHEDGFFEEFLPNKEEKKLILEEILENF